MPTKLHGITVYTVKEAAAELQLSTNTIHKYIRNKKLKAQKVGKSWVITETSIRQYLKPLIS